MSQKSKYDSRWALGIYTAIDGLMLHVKNNKRKCLRVKIPRFFKEMADVLKAFYSIWT